MKQYGKALLIVAPLALLLVVPVAAQTTTPLVFTSLYPGGSCEASCVNLMVDGDPNTGCGCWNMTWCVDSAVNIVEFEILTDWPEGMNIAPQLDGELGRYTRVLQENPQGRRWFRVTNLGQADCVVFSGRNDLGGWGDPVIYEVRGASGAGTMDVFSGNFWMVNSKVGQVLGAEVVANYIYAILALAVGTLGLAMIIRGLFRATGAHTFGHGSGLGHSGSGVTYPTREVGDVD